MTLRDIDMTITRGGFQVPFLWFPLFQLSSAPISQAVHCCGPWQWRELPASFFKGSLVLWDHSLPSVQLSDSSAPISLSFGHPEPCICPGLPWLPLRLQASSDLTASVAQSGFSSAYAPARINPLCTIWWRFRCVWSYTLFTLFHWEILTFWGQFIILSTIPILFPLLKPLP